MYLLQGKIKTETNTEAECLMSFSIILSWKRKYKVSDVLCSKENKRIGTYHEMIQYKTDGSNVRHSTRDRKTTNVSPKFGNEYHF